MERSAGQQYVASVFGRGIAQDMMFDLPLGQVRDTYISTERMAVNQDLINGLRSVNGDADAGEIYSSVSSISILGTYMMSGHLYSFVSTSGDSDIRIYRDTTLIGQSADYPGDHSSGYLYIDGNSGSGELAITDNDQVPVVLDVDDMYAHAVIAVDAKYTTDYDRTLYEVNRSINLTQPVFRDLNEVGVGGGLKPGSYAYAYRLVSDNDDVTPWSPPTPFIPVPEGYGQGTEPTYLPGAKTYGSAPSQNATRYGIDIAFRIINEAGYDFIEIKRIPNNVGGPVEYTASPQFIRLETAISETVITVVNFTDVGNVDWAPLDDSNTIQNSIIATSRTVRFYDNRLVLGGLTYESRVFDDDTVFGATGVAVKKDIGIEGYTDIHNQVYNKSQRLGERYGYALQITDTSGSLSFALPHPGLKNFKFPDRREVASSLNGDTVTAATVNSDTIDTNLETFEVYDQGSSTKTGSRTNNIVEGIQVASVDEPYQALHPINREDSDDYESAAKACSIVEGATAHNPQGYGHSIHATGLRISGLDTTKFPSWASGISVLRTEPAGRVVAQGIGTYALIEALTTSVDKALNKLWFYSPELDDVIGDKPGIFTDIIDNPDDYELQLVSPIGFFPEYYSGVINSISDSIGIDFASMATPYYAGGNDINPFDADVNVGRGSGYVTFGRWRNVNPTYNQGSGIIKGSDPDNTYVMGISAARQNTLPNGTYGHNMVGRSKYLEITLDANVYAYGNISGAANDAAARQGHEPFYVVNIVKRGANVADNNIDQYKEIGHYIPLNSIIGYGTGVLGQEVEITSERIDDFHWAQGTGGAFIVPSSSEEYTYIWVNGQRWLNVTHWRDSDINTIRGNWVQGSSFTQASDSGDVCEPSYGIYDVSIRDGVYYISFLYEDTSSNPIIPLADELIQVRYDSTKYIDVFLGDTVIGPASFLPVDVGMKISDLAYGGGGGDRMFKLTAPFPYSSFQFEDGVYYSPRDPGNSTAGDRYETGTDIDMQDIRQWLVSFMCESTVNLPFVYKDFFPYKNYVMRPIIFDQKDDDETEKQYLAGLNIYPQYAEDYPEEYLKWNYGGFHLPQGSNFDYQKQHRDIYTELPIGVTEILDHPKGVHWGAKRSAASISRGISKSFPATNAYDILLKDAQDINILYSHYSTKGDNLYAVLDQGVVGLLTDKNVLRDGVADELGVILSDSGFIQGEIILDPLVGCPDLRWRGRAEGSIKTAQNVYVPGLVFHGQDDIFLLSGNGVVSIGTNFRDTMVDVVKGIGEHTVLTSAFDHARNELWTKIGSDVYLYGFSINNWVGKITESSLAALENAPIYGSTRNARVGVSKALVAGDNILSIIVGDTGVDFDSDITTVTTPNTSASFAVTPTGLAQWEFTDIFINSNVIPSSLVVSVNKDMSDPYTATSFKDVNGLYRTKLGRTAGGRTLLGNTLYVTLNFTPGTSIDLGYVRTGYKKVVGS